MREKSVNSRSNSSMDTKIRLFGGFFVTRGQEESTTEIKGQKPQALLAWLALHQGRANTREHVANLLWAGRSQANARASLRQAVAVIRKALPEDAVLADTHKIDLNPQTVWVDAQAFRRLHRQIKPGAQSSDSTDAINEAIALYRGELLSSFRSNAEPFDEWLFMEREVLRRDALDLLSLQLQQALASQQRDTAVAACERLLQIDPLQEHVHRELMQLYVQDGQIGSALRQFRLCRDLLERELSVPPAPATVALFQAIRSGEQSGATVTAADSSAAAPSAPANTAEPPAGITAQTNNSNRLPVLPSIAVLPFASMSSDPEHGYLADGMTEELINLLANCVNWRVTARNSSFRYKDKHVDIREVGEQLGVAYVVEGSIRRVAERIRVTAQLITTEDGTHVWSDRYDRNMADIFEVQDEVVHNIFRALKNRIGFAERERVRRTQRANLDAWGLLIKAQQARVVDSNTRDEQRQLVYEALSIDPGYPRAHAYLASIIFISIGRGYTSDAVKDLATAKQHAEMALSQGGTDPVVLKMTAGGFAAIGDAERAMRLAQRAFEISGTPDALFVAVLMWNGRIDEAIGHCQAIVDSQAPGMPTPPGELRPVALLGNLRMLQGDYQAALGLAEEDLLANPGNYFSHINLANVLGYLGYHSDAMNAWQKARSLMPGLNLKSFRFGYKSVFVDPQLAARLSDGLALAGVTD